MTRWKLIALTVAWGFGYVLLMTWEVWVIRNKLPISSWEIALIDTLYLVGGASWLASRS